MKANLFGLDVSLADMISGLAGIPLRYQPGTKFVYSVGPDIQARLVEILSGMPFDEFLEQRLFKPLSMRDAGFWVPADKAKRLATVHWMKDGKLVPLDETHGHPTGMWLFEPWTVNSYTVDHKRKGGSYGLVSTAEDYWRFAQMMLNGGELDGTRILSPQVVRYMARSHFDVQTAAGKPAGIGFGPGSL
jgi:CubicO group peptidase (beta-lactamase class C family)